MCCFNSVKLSMCDLLYQFFMYNNLRLQATWSHLDTHLRMCSEVT